MTSSPWVVIPTYNEKDNITNIVKALFSLTVPNLSVLIVDDNSPDGTADIVRDLQKDLPRLNLVVREKKAGLGQAYIHGFQHALKHGASAVVQMDADFSHDPNDVPKLLKKTDSFDLVVGSRYVNGISVINWPLKRLLLSIGGNVYAKIVTGLSQHDITGGFRAWSKHALEELDLSSIQADGYGFQVVTIYRAWKKKLKIIEVPIIFTERREGQSKMSTSIMWEAVFLVWRLRLFGK